MPAPATLDHAGIAARIPHAGRMCLLDALCAWDEARIECRADSHRDPAHPLRSASGLLVAAAIEYAGQAMALHGALLGESLGPSLAASSPGTPAAPQPGFLASVRQVRFGALRLDDRPGPLRIRAGRLAGDARQEQYTFRVDDAGGLCLAEGRATIVFALPDG